MEAYKKDFIDFMVRAGVLTFGDFTTKSGRKTPFFINTGNYRSGSQMQKLGQFYAKAINAKFGKNFDVIFGPAYKGIPLVVTSAIALSEHFDHDVDFCFNRKEIKTHGERGNLVGKKLADGDRVLIIEDVTTAGTSIRETVPILQAAADVKLAGLIVSVDRMEKGLGEYSALTELHETFKFPTTAIVTIEEVVEYLHNKEIDGKIIITDEINDRITDYRNQYGAK